MSNRRRPDLSSRLKATRWPPASSTATVSGAQLVSRPFLSAVSTMVEACASVTNDMRCLRDLFDDPFTLAVVPAKAGTQRHRMDARFRGHDNREGASAGP